MGHIKIYNNKYSKDTTSMFVSLPNSNSAITYEVTVINNTSIRYQLKDILENSYTNKNINYEIIGLKKDQIISKNTTIKFIVEPFADATNKFHTISDISEASGIYYGWADYLGIDLSVLLVSFHNNKSSVFSNEPVDVTNIETITFDIRMVANHEDLSFVSYIGIIDSLTVQDTDQNKFMRVQSIQKKKLR